MAKTIQAFVNTGTEAHNQTHQFEQGNGDRGQPTRIKAVKGARYQLKNPLANEVGPEYIRSKRVDKNLHVSLYGSTEADLIIEGYYEEGFLAVGSTGLYGMTESGQIYEYIPETPTTAGLAANLTDGASPTSQVLGGAPIEGAFVLSALPLATLASTGINSTWLTAGAAVATAAAVTTKGGSDSPAAVVPASNHAPVLTSNTTARSYTENAAAMLANGTLTLSDEDSANLTSATVQITSGLTTGDVLAFTDTAKITSVYDASTGLLTLTGTATKAEYQAALQAVTFSSSSDNPGTSRTLTWQVDDGQSANHASNSATSTINITAVNDAPLATNDAATAKEAGGANNATVATDANPTGNVLTNDSDPEGAALSIKTIVKGTTGIGTDVAANTTSASTNATTIDGNFGALKIGANGSYVYTVNNTNTSVQALNVNDILTDVFTYTVMDATGATSTAKITVTVNGANDAPVLADPIADTTATEGTAMSYVVPSTAFTDVDNTLTFSAVVVDAQGNPLAIHRRGYDHFSPEA